MTTGPECTTQTGFIINFQNIALTSQDLYDFKSMEKEHSFHEVCPELLVNLNILSLLSLIFASSWSVVNLFHFAINCNNIYNEV
jgi:hypothetical protein